MIKLDIFKRYYKQEPIGLLNKNFFLQKSNILIDFQSTRCKAIIKGQACCFDVLSDNLPLCYSELEGN